jgi:hypothetical protein
MFLTVVGVLAAALAGFVFWLLTSVARGARARDEALLRQLAPLAEKLAKAAVSASEVEPLARVAQLRPMLYAMLAQRGRLDLFPSEHLTRRAQAESALSYWMLHPNELRATPARIELLETLRRTLGTKQAEFFVFRYQMPQGHWAGPAWLLGLAGPFYPDEKPYAGIAGFSRATDIAGKVSASEIVDRYVGLLERKLAA